jgi:hypothetical protein
MAAVAAGSRLRVLGISSALTVRSLRTTELDGGWLMPVLGDVAALQTAGLSALPVHESGDHKGLRTLVALVEFPTDAGPLRLEAEIVSGDGVFLLRAPGLRTADLSEQRREDVRGLVHLPIRGTVLSRAASREQAQAGPAEPEDADQAGPAHRPPGPDADEEPASAELAGITESVSAGGISVDLERSGWVTPGCQIYLEMSLPNGDVAPAVLSVLARDGARVRARFLDISPLDRERLVRLVFARQRAELAERRRADDSR